MRRFMMLMGVGLCLGLFQGASARADVPLWKLVGDKDDANFVAVKFNTASGQSWVDNGGSWLSLTETGSPTTTGNPGDYEIVTYYVGASWYGLRWNVRTGQTWKCNANQWVDMPTPGS
jgi:hypothetical protein